MQKGHPKRIVIANGDIFGRLTVIQELEQRGSDRRILCRCNCGVVKDYSMHSLRRGMVVSCGCYGAERRKEPKYSKRTENHLYVKTRLYNIWCDIKKRCNNPKHWAYKYYGANGIKMCPEWSERFIVFRDWALANGYDDLLTIERSRVNEGYCPANCTWIPIADQNNNKTNSRRVEYNGALVTVRDLSVRMDLHYQTLTRRLNAGWTVQDAVETPIDKRFSKRYNRAS